MTEAEQAMIDYLREFMRNARDTDIQPCGECEECHEGLRCRELDSDGDWPEAAAESVWCNARDDKPSEYFSHTPILAVLDMDEIERLLDLAAVMLEAEMD